MVRMPHWPTPVWQNHQFYDRKNLRSLLAAIGNPEQKLPPVIHVTGTNGKGSTVAFIRSILEAAGYKVHCYTSPHLLQFNERIRIASRLIDDDYLFQMIERCRIAQEKIALPVTFFEGTTAAALLAFSENKADFTIVEVGMGGEHDATNLIDKKIVTVITPISYDHTELLGKTITEIALEKAGIMRKNIPCIVSMQLEEAYNTIEQKAEAKGAPLCAFEYDFGIRETATGFTYLSEARTLELPLPNLVGEHQIINAATAIATVQNIEKLSQQTIAKGITAAYWPARLEQLRTGKIIEQLPLGWELWIDGAHNESGSQILSLWAERRADKPIYLICGLTQGRDGKRFLAHLTGKVEMVAGVLVEGEPSSYQASVIAESAQAVGIPAIASSSIEEAIDFFIQNAEKPAIILACGSLYLAADIMRLNGKSSL